MPTSLTLFFCDDAARDRLSDALAEIDSICPIGTIADACDPDAPQLLLVRLDPDQFREHDRPGQDASRLRACCYGHRVLLAQGSSTENQLRLARALLPDRPQARHRMALHTALDTCDAALHGVSGIGTLPAGVIEDGAVAARTRLDQLAGMQSEHVIVDPDALRTPHGFAVTARAATDCAVSVGSTGLVLHLVAYARVRGWLARADNAAIVA